MEASGLPASPVEAAPAASNPHDVSGIHSLLDQAEQAFHDLFSGDHAPSTQSHVDRLTPHLNTVRMVVDLAADEAGKE